MLWPPDADTTAKRGKLIPTSSHDTERPHTSVRACRTSASTSGTVSVTSMASSIPRAAMPPMRPIARRRARAPTLQRPATRGPTPATRRDRQQFPQRHTNVAHQPAPLRPQDRTAAKAGAKRLLRDPQQWDQRRAGGVGIARGEHRPPRLARAARAHLPARAQPPFHHEIHRAHLLADVAAKDQIADQRAQFQRDRAAMLDRQITDAAAGIQHAGGGECIGRAGVRHT